MAKQTVRTEKFQIWPIGYGLTAVGVGTGNHKGELHLIAIPDHLLDKIPKHKFKFMAPQEPNEELQELLEYDGPRAFLCPKAGKNCSRMCSSNFRAKGRRSIPCSEQCGS